MRKYLILFLIAAVVIAGGMWWLGGRAASSAPPEGEIRIPVEGVFNQSIVHPALNRRI
jgi:hypothetical protein